MRRKKAKKADDLGELEYRAKEDDAWYSVSVDLDSDAQTLTIKYSCFPVVSDLVFKSAGFQTEAQVDELETRFRPLSHQVQDRQCSKLAVGTTVCAAHSTKEDDLRFYDAVVETVNHQAHSFAAGGEEKCLCTFVLFWLHGRGRGTLTAANIADICTLDRFSQVDQRISDFLIMAKDKISSSKSVSVLKSFGSGTKGPSSKSDKKSSLITSIEKNLDPSRIGLPEEKTRMTSKSRMQQKTGGAFTAHASELITRSDSPVNISHADSSWISNYEQWTSQDDKDLGPQHHNIDGLSTRKDQHFILINNLENDLSPSSIKKLIYEKTNILPQAFVFPIQLSDPFARGAIVVDCPKKVQIVYEFLSNPNQIIVSSRGRPWVVSDKTLTGTSRTSVWNLHPMILDETQYKEAGEELKIVHSGTESYNRAQELKNMFVEFIHHESQVRRKLALEEKKIRRSFNKVR